jgi:tripartite ATP-independent transporter DctM subunit
LDWSIYLIILLVLILFMFALGMPVAFGFLFANIVGLAAFTGGVKAWSLIISSAFDSLRNFTYWAIPLYLLMGEVLSRGGAISRGLAAVSDWAGRVPGRLGVVSIINGAVFGAMSGSTLASTALLSQPLSPEMRKYGYSTSMIAGSILAGGCLDLIIPPSNFVIVIGALANESTAKLLIAGIIPGLILASLFVGYFILMAWRNPDLAPPYTLPKRPLSKRLMETVHVLPVACIIFVSIFTILLGVCTPTEAAALGTLCALILAAGYRKLNFTLLRESALSVTRASAMIFMIIVGSSSFSQFMAVTGATKGLVSIVVNLDLSPVLINIIMQIIVLILGCFIEPISIMMISIPIFMPVARVLGFDPIWFLTILLINLMLGGLTPPFGLQLFVYKGCDPQAKMEEIYRSAMPIILLTLLGVVVVWVFPSLITWLPGLMGK